MYEKKRSDSQSSLPYRVDGGRDKRFLNGVAEERCIVATIALGQALLSGVLGGLLVEDAVAACILAAEVEGHENAKEGAHGQRAHQGAVARAEMRLVLGKVAEAGDRTSQVAESDVHAIKQISQNDFSSTAGRRVDSRNANTTLRGATDVVAVPGHTLRDVGVDTDCGEEGANVLDSVIIAGVEHREADDGHNVEDCHRVSMTKTSKVSETYRS